MKQRLKIMAMFFCAMAIMASCTKENDPSNGGNGNSQYDYTLGYFHPAKKIKKIVISDSVMEFIWDGDNLSFILNRVFAQNWIEIDTIHYEYNSDGRISCIWDSTGINHYHRVTYNYYADLVEVHTVCQDGEGVWSDDAHLSPILDIDYSVDYDQANNPLKDLMWYEFINDGYIGDPIASHHDARYLHNRTGYGDVEYRYDYDNDNYPTVCWEQLTDYSGNPDDRVFYRFFYYPMGDNSDHGSYNGHDYVDLGLPNGTLWATCNVGADTPESPGYRFAWGETSPKNTYNWDNYKYCNNGDYNQLTKYCSNITEGYNGYIDNLNTLQPEDDAATVNWGDGWRIPNMEECLELLNYTTYEEITRNNEKGWLITGPNGNTIFMPSIYSGELRGRYWSNSRDDDVSIYAGYFTPLGNNIFSEERCCGFPIRPVYKPTGGGSTPGQENTYTITVSANPSEAGTVSGGGTFRKDQICTVKADQSDGYTFVSWTENGNVVFDDDWDYSFRVNANRNLVANFSVNTYYVNVSTNPSNCGTVTGGGSYTYGQSCTVKAIPATGYMFKNWTVGDNVYSSDEEYTFTVEGDINLKANFITIPEYYISVRVDINTSYIHGGLVSIIEEGSEYEEEMFQQGQSCTVHAISNLWGVTFVNWTKYHDGTVVSTDANYTFTVTNGLMLQANFSYNGGGVEFVDLGLPSGTLWATCNVGANTPEGRGDYFAWGETQSKDIYNWRTYLYCNGTENTYTKYCDNPNYGYNGFTDNLTTLLPEDDAAMVNLGVSWRMPTREEWRELINNTTNRWWRVNGVSGRLFQAANGRSLFLRAAGYYWNYVPGSNSSDNEGHYWSSSLCLSEGWSISFGEGNFGSGIPHVRPCGMSVRAVRAR